MTDFQKKYFVDEEAYPGLGVFQARDGCFYEYVSSPLMDFISLWVNKPYVRGALISRYQTYEENKQEYENLLEEDAPVHFSVGESVGDDLLVLARGEDPRGPKGNRDAWWVIWFDRDVSDCCFGYFTTKDPDSQVIESFEEWVNGLSEEMGYQPPEHQGPAFFLPMDKFSGWWKW